MDRVFEAGAAGSAPAAPATPSTGFATGGNPGGGVPATKPGAYWFHMITEELRRVIVDAGLTPNHTNVAQLSQAIGLLSPSVAPGAIVPFARNTPPTGWLKANGALVPRTTYAGLFAAIGTTFGVGDGATTFGLPDLRGEFVRGWDDGRGVDSGRVFGSAQADEFKSHTHTATTSSAISGASSSGTIGSPVATITGATGGAETRPRNIALLVCIKF